MVPYPEAMICIFTVLYSTNKIRVAGGGVFYWVGIIVNYEKFFYCGQRERGGDWWYWGGVENKSILLRRLSNFLSYELLKRRDRVGGRENGWRRR